MSKYCGFVVFTFTYSSYTLHAANWEFGVNPKLTRSGKRNESGKAVARHCVFTWEVATVGRLKVRISVSQIHSGISWSFSRYPRFGSKYVK